MNGSRTMDLAGWEAFVHGVFAITITLLVLDIRVPPANGTLSASALVNALLAEGPRYMAYLLGFMYVGVYWIATFRSLRMARWVDHVFLVIGLVYLMSIAVIPFVSALLAEYLAANDGRSQVVVVVFIGWQLLVSTLAYLSLLYSSRAGLLKPDLDEANVRAWRRFALAGSVSWLAAIIGALVIGATALAFPVILLAIYLWGGPKPSAA
jgi:uncharacterized membrane protein